ncbi:MAG: MotA/TolQ/ExbB proton channel family protein [Hyphomicrobiaceae bacterium]|nr:MotA/TolQ/ExbB proton channel family protein [Hyphomicrobiaceae bacterium]
MDLATIIGIVSAFGVVVAAIFMGGSFSQFVDVPSVLIVVGGGFAATIIRFPLSDILNSLIIGGKSAFTHRKVNSVELIEEIANLGDIVRKNGPLGLENVEVSHPMLAKGVQYVTDGYDVDFVRESLERERDLYLERLVDGQRFFKALGDSAPAFGMIGTLVGLVQMLATMDDPSTIGPSMAIALLTTLYGALISNVICLPVYDKLMAKQGSEEINLTLIIDGVTQVRENKSPTLIREMLLAYLPEKHRAQLQAA